MRLWWFVLIVSCSRSAPTRSKLDDAFGPSAATPGPLFEGLVVGGPEDARAQQLATRWEAEREKTRYNVRAKFVGGTIVELGVNTMMTDGASGGSDCTPSIRVVACPPLPPDAEPAH